MDETTRIVNPTWRRLDGQVRRNAALQHRRKARLHDLELQGTLDAAKTEHYMSRAEALRSEIEAAAITLKTLTEQRKTAGKHTTVSELPEEEKFLKLATRSKHFIDTIKILAYRAETALSRIVRETLNAHHHDEARALIRDICTTEADLHPDEANSTLTITLHSLATPKQNAAAAHLCTELTATETTYPGTKLRMIFKSVST